MEPNPNDPRPLLTNLVIEQRTHQGWAPSPEERESLVQELELALIDRETLRPILEYLQSIPPASDTLVESLTESEEEAILARGLRALSPARFDHLAIDPLALLHLRDIILDDLPAYWWEKIKNSGTRPPRSAAEIWEEAASADHRLALAALDSAQTPRRWVTTVPVDQVVRVAPADGPVPTVKIEWTLTPQAGKWQLVVELLTPPPRGGSRFVCRLLSLGGEEIGRGEEGVHPFRFTVASTEILGGSELHCDYQRGDADEIRFRVGVIVS